MQKYIVKKCPSNLKGLFNFYCAKTPIAAVSPECKECTNCVIKNLILSLQAIKLVAQKHNLESIEIEIDDCFNMLQIEKVE